MSTPSNLVLFRFPGYAPELSHGVAAVTQDGRLVITDAASNPGTSVRNAIDTAVPMALRTVGRDEHDTRVYLWTPHDPLEPDALWEVHLGNQTEWRHVDWQRDKQLNGAVHALKRALGFEPLG